MGPHVEKMDPTRVQVLSSQYAEESSTAVSLFQMVMVLVLGPGAA